MKTPQTPTPPQTPTSPRSTPAQRASSCASRVRTRWRSMMGAVAILASCDVLEPVDYRGEPVLEIEGQVWPAQPGQRVVWDPSWRPMLYWEGMTVELHDQALLELTLDEQAQPPTYRLRVYAHPDLSKLPSAMFDDGSYHTYGGLAFYEDVNQTGRWEFLTDPVHTRFEPRTLGLRAERASGPITYLVDRFEGCEQVPGLDGWVSVWAQGSEHPSTQGVARVRVDLRLRERPELRPNEEQLCFEP